MGINVTTGNDFYAGYSLLSGVSTLGLVYDTSGLAPERCYDYWPTFGMWDYNGYVVNNAISNITSAGWQDSKLEDNNNSQTWNLRQALTMDSISVILQHMVMNMDIIIF